MRLTLRTLLAYLDHTLDPSDETALGEKVQQSSFATELVRRIGGLLSDPRVSAPSPDAVGPANDANAVAEYLDSTLPAEATAEVERQCIESDEQLAEVAACHQVLTIALAEPAQVPPALRQRIYGQPPARGETPATAAETVATAPPMDAPVTPVGPADSGVADATTRLPQDADLTATLAAATATIRKHRARDRRAASEISPVRPAMAGDRTREALEAIGPLLSGGRPSRVMPWLVSLGLAAAFLFVLTQAFEPFSRKRNQEVAERVEVSPEDEVQILESTSPPPPVPDDRPQADGPQANRRTPSAAENRLPAGDDDEDMDAVTAAPPVPAEGGTAADDAPPQPPGDADRNATGDPVTADVVEVTEGAPPPPTGGEPGDTPPAGGGPIGAAASDAEATSEAPPAPGTATSDPAGRSPVDAGVNEVDPSTGEAAGDDAEAAAAVIGRVEDDGGLLLTQDPNSGAWGQVTEASLTSGTVLVSSPTFRSRLALDSGAELTLIGATGVRIDAADAAAVPRLTIDFGRVLIAATDGPLEIRVATPAASGSVTLSATGATAAVSVEYRRPRGADPGSPESSRATLSLLSVQDAIEWEPLQGGEPQTIETGERLRIVAGGTPQIDVPASIPGWLDPPDPAVATIEATARRGLVEFLSGDQEIIEALQDAVGFRREEVAALAARTLLNLGMPDSYFGNQGVLNRPAQRTYWPELTAALYDFVDRGPQSAAIVARSVTRQEPEAADELLRLLQGFSPDQLEAGGDATLVAMLDHPAMSVRVLATESLRHITGTSLYYRPDYDTAARRAPVLKKWETELERDRIRYPDPAP